jgi:hypothetical protein
VGAKNKTSVAGLSVFNSSMGIRKTDYVIIDPSNKNYKFLLLLELVALPRSADTSTTATSFPMSLCLGRGFAYISQQGVGV